MSPERLPVGFFDMRPVRLSAPRRNPWFFWWFDPRARGVPGASRRLKTLLAALTLMLGCAAGQAASYSYTAPNYTTFINFTAPCATGSCANFTSAMHTQGTFETAAPLPANQPLSSIAPLVTSFSFSDGMVTYSSADPRVSVLRFETRTDATGEITDFFVVLLRWQNSAPHANGSRADTMTANGGSAQPYHNRICTSYDSATDSCMNLNTDASSSFGFEGLAAVPVPVAIHLRPVPTLDVLGLSLLAMLVALIGARGFRKPT